MSEFESTLKLSESVFQWAQQRYRQDRGDISEQQRLPIEQQSAASQDKQSDRDIQNDGQHREIHRAVKLETCVQGAKALGENKLVQQREEQDRRQHHCKLSSFGVSAGKKLKTVSQITSRPA